MARRASGIGHGILEKAGCRFGGPRASSGSTLMRLSFSQPVRKFGAPSLLPLAPQASVVVGVFVSVVVDEHQEGMR